MKKTGFLKYNPQLIEIVGTQDRVLMVASLEYRFSIRKYREKGFFKFKEPALKHKAYKAGDSFTEELNMSRPRFNRHFDQIGVRYQSKKDYMAACIDGDPFQGKPYLSYFERPSGRTFFLRNNELADKMISPYFVTPKKTAPKTIIKDQTDTAPQSKTALSDMESEVFKNFIKIFEDESQGQIAMPALNQNFVTKVESVFKEYFAGSLDQVREFFKRVVANDWLMGRLNKDFIPNLNYLLQGNVIAQVMQEIKKFVTRRSKRKECIVRSSITKEVNNILINNKKLVNFVKKQNVSDEELATYNLIAESLTQVSEGVLVAPKAYGGIVEKTLKIFRVYFDGDLQKLKEYFSRVARSSWMMGEKTSQFKANLSYLMNPDTITKVMNDNFYQDRETEKDKEIKTKYEVLKAKTKEILDQYKKAEEEIEREVKQQEKEILLQLEKSYPTLSEEEAFKVYLKKTNSEMLEDKESLGFWDVETTSLENALSENIFLKLAYKEYILNRAGVDLESRLSNLKLGLEQRYANLYIFVHIYKDFAKDNLKFLNNPMDSFDPNTVPCLANFILEKASDFLKSQNGFSSHELMKAVVDNDLGGGSKGR